MNKTWLGLLRLGAAGHGKAWHGALRYGKALIMLKIFKCIMLIPSTYRRMACVVFVGIAIFVLAKISHRESCDWNTSTAPNYGCGVMTAMEKNDK